MLRALALVTTATVLAAVDLAHKAVAGEQALHARSGGYVVVVIVLSAAWGGAILATGSLALAVAGGVVAGGALGNVVSLALWDGVPNPILLEIAFNLADLFVVAGFVLVAVAILGLALTNPGRLREPVTLRS